MTFMESSINDIETVTTKDDIDKLQHQLQHLLLKNAHTQLSMNMKDIKALQENLKGFESCLTNLLQDKISDQILIEDLEDFLEEQRFLLTSQEHTIQYLQDIISKEYIAPNMVNVFNKATSHMVWKALFRLTESLAIKYDLYEDLT